MLINQTVSKNIVYIKMSRYVTAFLRYVYKASPGEPIFLPELYPYSNARLRKLHEELYSTFTDGVITPDWLSSNMQPNCSYSMSAVDIVKNEQEPPIQNPNLFPTKECLNTLAPFALPDTYKINRTAWAYTDSKSQLSVNATVKFRSIVSLMFWYAVITHVDYFFDPDVFNNYGAAIEDFAQKYNIPYEEVDTMIRQYRRKRNSTLKIVNNFCDAVDPARPIFFLKKS